MKDIAQRLEAEIARRGHTQHEAAALIKSADTHQPVSQATISRWVMRQNYVRSEYWASLGRYLGLTRDQVAKIVNEAKSVDPAEERMNQLEGRFDEVVDQIASLQGTVDELREVLAPTPEPGSPPVRSTRRRAR